MVLALDVMHLVLTLMFKSVSSIERKMIVCLIMWLPALDYHCDINSGRYKMIIKHNRALFTATAKPGVKMPRSAVVFGGEEGPSPGILPGQEPSSPQGGDTQQDVSNFLADSDEEAGSDGDFGSLSAKPHQVAFQLPPPPQGVLKKSASSTDDADTVASFLDDSDENNEFEDHAQGRLRGMSRLGKDPQPPPIESTSDLKTTAPVGNLGWKPKKKQESAAELAASFLDAGSDEDDDDDDFGSLKSGSKKLSAKISNSASSTSQTTSPRGATPKAKKPPPKIRFKSKYADPRAEVAGATTVEDSDDDDDGSNRSSSSDDGAGGEYEGEAEDFLAGHDHRDGNAGAKATLGHSSSGDDHRGASEQPSTVVASKRGLTSSASRKVLQANMPAEFATNEQLYYALSLVRCLRFTTLSLDQQRAMINSITLRSCDPRDGPIIKQGDREDASFYILVGPEDDSEVVVTELPDEMNGSAAGGNANEFDIGGDDDDHEGEGQEREITHLGVGACFGERPLINPPGSSGFTPRASTIRPYGDRPITVAQVQLADFHIWQPLRLALILGDVPLLQKLPDFSRGILQERLHFVRYAPGEFVFREGDVGDCFYMLTRGEVQVTDQGYGPVPPNPPRVLVNLGEGSCFGESSLVLDAPRNASVQVELDGDTLL